MSEKNTAGLMIVIFCIHHLFGFGQPIASEDTIFCTHKLMLDSEGKLLPWYTPQDRAYDHFLHLRWEFIKTKVPDSPGPAPRSNYPQYYFYDGFYFKNGLIEPDFWMNDVGEKIPNWFENARLYYAYTGDTSVMTMVKDMIDYTLEHGTSPSDFAWPNFPYTTTNPGDIEFRGLTKVFELHETHIDHAAEMGLTYYRMYLYSGDQKYLTASVNVANVLAAKSRPGTAGKSVWPYRVNMETGKITAEYGANWTGAYMLFDHLIHANLGDVATFKETRERTKVFLLQFPLKTGYWTDGHSDNPVNSNTYRSNLSASNMKLVMFDYPGLNPDWKLDIPRLIKWTEDYFIFRGAPGEPSTMWGAHIVGEQDGFNHKMDYQTARYAAECARWYAISGDEKYKEKAYRSLNWVTYCNDSDGMAFESPVSEGIASWWSDCYGECPRMFYHAFAGIPEWAPPRENHILYSEGILRNVHYSASTVAYNATKDDGIEYLRLAYKPMKVTLNGQALPGSESPEVNSYKLKDLGGGDYSVIIRREKAGNVFVIGPGSTTE
jgi:hypothetical protein